MSADLVLLNGKIVTMSESEIVDAVAVKFGRILAVGTTDEVRKLVGAETKIVDLMGKTVVPGMIDSHCHMIATGISSMSDVDLSEEAGVRSIADVKARIAKKAEEIPEGAWITGVREDDSKLLEKRHPTKWELDEAAPDNPVVISTVGGHYYVTNSTAFVRAGVTKDTPDPIGGVFERDATGELTGGLHEKALDVVFSGKASEGLSKAMAAEGAGLILLANAAVGLTCVYEMVDGLQLRAVLDLKNNGGLPIRVRMDVEIGLFPEMNRLGIIQGFGDEWAKICGLKFFFDGAISARTAAVREPYMNRPDYYGVMSTTKEIASETILEAYEAGYRISAHANGERAIEMYLDIMREAQAKYPRNEPRNRIIHCSIITPDLVSKIKKLELLPTIFGPYPYYHGDKLIPAFGEKRLERMFAARSFLDAGIKVAAHSDHDASPFSPLMGIHAMVNRKTKTGKPIGQSQKVSVMEALKLYTVNAAYHSFDEDSLGSIEVGKCADMVVLGKDILTVPPETIIDIPIEMTIVGGRTVYERDLTQTMSDSKDKSHRL
jgi:predicted amidohydrolase YtcJ